MITNSNNDITTINPEPVRLAAKYGMPVSAYILCTAHALSGITLTCVEGQARPCLLITMPDAGNVQTVLQTCVEHASAPIAAASYALSATRREAA